MIDKPIFPIRKIGKYFSKPIDKIGKWVYYLAIESKQINERSGMQCLKSILMQHSLVVECVSPGHIRMAGCIRIHFVAPETWFFRRDIITPFARELIEAPAFFVLGFPEFNQKERNFP